MTTSNESPGSGPLDTSVVAHAVHSAMPGSRVLAVERMGPDPSAEQDGDDATTKQIGYGEPLLVRLQAHDGKVREFVFHTATSNVFGHQHRADRALSMLLAYDTFRQIPRHAEAIDVGAIRLDGSGLVSLKDTGEFYLLTEYVPGYVYADELRAVAQRGEARAPEIEQVTELALYLAELHTRVPRPQLYRRSVRDLLGSGEGIFGIIDGYPSESPGAPRMVLERIERLCLPWRWKLRDYEHRAARIHGDFHPFNVVFSDSGVRLLDASRGCIGDPADDVICMAINFVFFGLLRPGTWKPCFRRLWNAYWNTYLTQAQDHEVLEVVAPYFAWRALVLSNPEWYPSTPSSVREKLLTLVEQQLGSARFDPGIAETLFRDEEPKSSR